MHEHTRKLNPAGNDMTEKAHNDSTKVEQQSEIAASRRKLITGGAAAVVALSSRSALATYGTCQSPSDKLSGNVSPGHNKGKTCTLGRSPGYWKQPLKFSTWPIDPPTLETRGTSSWVTDTSAGPTIDAFSYTTLTSGKERVKPVPSYSSPDFGTSFVSFFVVDPGFKRVVPNPVASGATAAPNQARPISMWEIMAYPVEVDNGTGLGQLARHCIAAYLSALSSSTYPVTTTQIKAMWDAGRTGVGYCPIPGCTTSWDTTAIISYLSGTFA